MGHKRNRTAQSFLFSGIVFALYIDISTVTLLYAPMEDYDDGTFCENTAAPVNVTTGESLSIESPDNWADFNSWLLSIPDDGHRNESDDFRIDGRKICFQDSQSRCTAWTLGNALYANHLFSSATDVALVLRESQLTPYECPPELLRTRNKEFSGLGQKKKDTAKVEDTTAETQDFRDLSDILEINLPD